MTIRQILKNKKTIGVFSILFGLTYYIFFFGKLLYYFGLRFLDIFDLAFEGLTLPTAINPIIVPFWGLYESIENLPNWFFPLNYLIMALPPLSLLVGGIGLLKGKNWARRILIAYGGYWIISFLSLLILIIHQIAVK